MSFYFHSSECEFLLRSAGKHIIFTDREVGSCISNATATRHDEPTVKEYGKWKNAILCVGWEIFIRIRLMKCLSISLPWVSRAFPFLNSFSIPQASHPSLWKDFTTRKFPRNIYMQHKTCLKWRVRSLPHACMSSVVAVQDLTANWDLWLLQMGWITFFVEKSTALANTRSARSQKWKIYSPLLK